MERWMVERQPNSACDGVSNKGKSVGSGRSLMYVEIELANRDEHETSLVEMVQKQTVVSLRSSHDRWI
jgi:hypothetical protein